MFAEVPKIARVAHASRHRVFDTTPTVARAVSSAVFHRAIFRDERRSAKARAESITHTIFNPYQNTHKYAPTNLSICMYIYIVVVVAVVVVYIYINMHALKVEPPYRTVPS